MNPVLTPHLPNETMDRIISFTDRSLHPLLAHLYHHNEPIPRSLFLPHWIDLNLTLPEHNGVFPLVLPYTEDDPLCPIWAQQVAREARDRKEAALKGKLKMILNRANEAKWGLVKRVKMLSCPSVTHLNMAILCQVEQTVEELELVGLPDHVLPACDLPPADRTLDYSLLRCHLSFPSLHTLKIRARAIWWQGVATGICLLMPNLRRVELDFTVYPINNYDYIDEPFVMSLPSSKIEQLRVQWGPDAPGSKFDFDEGSFEHAVEWITFCPLLSQLVIASPGDDQEREDLAEALNTHRSVRDFCWNATASDLVSVVDDQSVRGVRRLVLALNQWVDTFDPLPSMPDLEHLYLDFSASPGNTPIWHLYPMPRTPLLSSMRPCFAASLRLNSKLHTIHTLRSPHNQSGFSIFEHLDEIEHSKSFSGYITSMVHGNEELLCARLVQDVVEVTGSVDFPYLNHPTHLHTIKLQIASDGSTGFQIFQSCAGFAWVYYTDFRGEVVPLEVIEEMRRVQGGDVDWERRGVKVGEAAWQVLLDWHQWVAGKVAVDMGVGSRCVG